MGGPYQVRWTRIAENDLESVTDFIAQDSSETAKKISRSIRKKGNSLKTNPNRGRRLPEFSHLPILPFRELIISPWRLIYRIQDKTVYILSFLDSRRDLEDLLFERLTKN